MYKALGFRASGFVALRPRVSVLLLASQQKGRGVTLHLGSSTFVPMAELMRSIAVLPIIFQLAEFIRPRNPILIVQAPTLFRLGLS